jgi:uridine kinase
VTVDPTPTRVPIGEPLRALLASQLGLSGAARTVIGIAGESGSGKTIASTELAAALTDAGIATGVLHQDDYFLRPPRTNHEHRVRDLRAVGPHEIDLPRLAAHVAAFRAGADGVVVPQVDYPGNRFVSRTIDFGAVAALIVEGTYVLGLDDLDVRVFCAATHEETAGRRRLRNRDVDAPIIDEILAIEHRLIAPQAALADVIVGVDFEVRLVRAA